jgi:SAM-dependent methyltransferase
MAFLAKCMKPFLNLVMNVHIKLVDARFVYRMGIPPKSTGRILKYPSLAIDGLSKQIVKEWQDLLLARFNILHVQHYGSAGRGYRTLAEKSESEREERYSSQQSRVEFFALNFNDLLDYRDGDSFADLGCGTGQNIRFLVQSYPNSRIVASDLSADAVAFVKRCEESNCLEVSTGDIRDPLFLDRLLNQPVDHIILSHVFSLIFADSCKETHVLRSRLISQMADRVNKSILIADGEMSRSALAVRVEQSQRAIDLDDVLGYFADLGTGRSLLARSDRTEAVIFQQRSKDLDVDGV